MKRHSIAPILTTALALSVGAWAADEPAPVEGRQREPSAAFQRLDADGNGTLSKDEFKKLATFGQGILKDRPEVLDRIFERLDADKDGALSLDEYKKIGDLRGRSSTPSSPAPPAAPQESDGGKPAAATAPVAPGAVPPEENYKKAADYSAKSGGRAVLVLVDGKTVFERYDNDSTADTATHLHSATKGFWGPVIAAMIEDKLIESYDELASKTLPEWKGDPRKGRITLRHLLTLSAGLEQDITKLQGHDRATLAPDLYKHAIGVQALREPGAVFQYGPSCYYVLGEIMKRKLAPKKQTPLDYSKERILNPIGVKIADWVHDSSGNPNIPNGAHLTARDWAKFGQWMLQGGEWNGKQIVRRDLLEELVKPSKANPGHGLAIWLNQPGGVGSGADPRQTSKPGDSAGWIYRDGRTDLFGALGAGKTRMYVIPSLKMVVVRQCDNPQDRYQDDAFLVLLLGGGAKG